MNRIPAEEIVWRKTGILQRHDGPGDGICRWWFDLPEPLASWDVFTYWERARFESLDQHLTTGDVLFDIGTEQGWCNLAYADIVGPSNMVLFEPTREFWPNIRQTWERNYYERPKACYQGLVGDQVDDDRPNHFGWPHASDGWIIDRNKYQYLHDNDGQSQITIDEFVKRSEIVPNAITMDIEGAELLALRGSTQTLIDHHPQLWISIHPDMSVRDYNLTDSQLHDYLLSHGYHSEHLATDHEEHWRFW